MSRMTSHGVRGGPPPSPPYQLQQLKRSQTIDLHTPIYRHRSNLQDSPPLYPPRTGTIWDPEAPVRTITNTLPRSHLHSCTTAPSSRHIEDPTGGTATTQNPCDTDPTTHTPLPQGMWTTSRPPKTPIRHTNCKLHTGGAKWPPTHHSETLARRIQKAA